MRLLLFIFLFSSFSYQKTYYLLFVGNSLTYTNDLPALVRKEAKKQGVKVRTKMLASPNYALVDHWFQGEAQKYIQTGKFDFVIMQQGPSSQADGKRMLLSSGSQFSKLCNQVGSELVFFMVWPSRRYYATYDSVISNYKNAAISSDAILCPVGEVWKNHFDETNDFSYYGLDGFHPSFRGSQVAAEVIVETLFNEKSDSN